MSNGEKGAVQSVAFRLVQAGVVTETILEHALPEGHVVVEPSLASVCHADLRYFTGQRRPEAMARKLPMALIHEGIGRIVRSNEPGLIPGQRVVIVPSMPGYMVNGTSPEQCCPVCRDRHVGDNYCRRGRFLASGTDGLAQNRLVVPGPCAIPVHDDIPDEIAVLSELCSVSVHALSRVGERLRGAKAAVFGDGPVGYLTASMLHHIYGLGRERLRVFGAIPEKLGQFAFADTALVQQYDFSGGEGVDVAIECTGGPFSESAVNQAIELLNPGGVLVLMGVTEERVPINTRDVLEKGITIIGSSRSSAKDYIPVLKAMCDPGCQATLRRLLPERYTSISSADQFVQAMQETVAHREWRKTILQFDWKSNSNSNRDNVYWQAHRGGGIYEAPDNTMAANRYAWQLGGIPEADIRTTKDGVIICLHDATAARTTDAPDEWKDVRVSELTFAQIRQWDAGRKFDERFAGERIPSLEEVFEELRGRPERLFYLDLKEVDLEQLGALIERYGVNRQIIFAHNKQHNCQMMKGIAPGVRTMLWIGGNAEQIHGKFQIALESGFEGLDQVQLHLHGLSGLDWNARDGSAWPYALDPDYLRETLAAATAAGVDFELLPMQFDERSIHGLLDLGIRWFATDEPSRFVNAVRTWK